MKTINTRFGQVDYDPDNLLYFPAGMIGFPQLHKFIVMPNKKEGPLFWIQSVDDPDIAFVLTDPSNFFLDYIVVPDETERKILQIANEDECFILTVVTVPPDQNITLNLSAPILFAPNTNRAIQVILDDPKYLTKTPLPK
ncbi:flagellar assembly protein FliW [Desulfopila aestuarii]|uniref:Flagellar assembly factor FliW n=1 Tax=Desulfopila aestuarii DSM 18488 TaxID=1121416 RepID=A0A1M7YDR4_9BACT|nr:flagellar assembly protein FliW [Desulfopila aestuarii]SHO50772.1 flagellar assembly factor FliW [Desulfopila aestuarii DSM 18488]